MSRVGNFTSSQMHRIMSKSNGSWSLENVGAPFKSYIVEKVREVRTGRPISADRSSRQTAWGTFVETFAFNKLSEFDKLVSKERYKHPTLPWSGMPDTITDGVVGDIKCPWTIIKFCDLADSIGQGVEAFKKNHKEYYWQLVSNAILCNVDRAKIVCYIPYRKDLAEIKELAGSLDEGKQNNVAFINWATDDELPYIIEENYYKDINILEFDVPQEDKDLLTQRVEMASKLLIQKLEN